MAEMLREVRTAVIWAAFGLGLFFAMRPVWSILLFGPNLDLEDLLSLRCFGFPT
jgi:hypothetical protein